MFLKTSTSPKRQKLGRFPDVVCAFIRKSRLNASFSTANRWIMLMSTWVQYLVRNLWQTSMDSICLSTYPSRIILKKSLCTWLYMYIPLYLLSKAPISIDNGHLSSQTGLLQTLEKETSSGKERRKFHWDRPTSHGRCWQWHPCLHCFFLVRSNLEICLSIYLSI